MSFPRYAKYKDSGVEWLGEVPDHWTVWKLAHAFDAIGSGTTPSTEQREYYDDGDIPWINTGDLNDSDIAIDVKQVTSKAMQDLSALRLFPAGCLAIAMYGATIGKLGLLTFPATVNQACCVFGESTAILTKFLFYWFLGMRSHLLSLATGGGQPNINREILQSLRPACPAPIEQSHIVSFLDQETAKIDALVAEQQRLIELLKEKRQAVISRVVTKGLNPGAPMKASGVEWLDVVPSDWSVLPIGYRYGVQLGKMLDTPKIAGTHLRPYIRVADVQWGEINTTDLPVMDFDEEARAKFELRAGDLVVNEGGSYVGRSALWLGELGECYYQKALHRMRPLHANDTSRFLYYLMFAATTAGVFVAGGNQNTIDHLTAEKLRKHRFPFPPIHEQTAIADYLDGQIDAFASLITEAELAISLLNERRTALISAAVTGKIDVRGLSGSEAA